MGIQKDILLINKRLTDINPLVSGEHDTDPGYSFGPTARPHYLLHYVFSGKGTFTTSRGVYKVKEGQIFIIRPWEITYYIADTKDPWHYSWVGFQADIDLSSILQKDVLDAPECSRFFYSILESKHMVSDKELYICGIIYQILATLSTGINRENSVSLYVRQAQNYIESNLNQSLRVDSLAENLGLNRVYFSRIFKHFTGKPPQQYILEMRLHKAAELLASGAFPGEAATQVGYENVMNFSRMFRKQFGMSPSMYRSGNNNDIEIGSDNSNNEKHSDNNIADINIDFNSRQQYTWLSNEHYDGTYGMQDFCLGIFAAQYGNCFGAVSPRTICVSNGSMDIIYIGDWEYRKDRKLELPNLVLSDNYLDGARLTETVGNYFSYTFLGVGVLLIAETDDSHGEIEIYIDGVLREGNNTELPNRIQKGGQTVYRITDLPDDIHTIKAVMKSGSFMALYRIEVILADLIRFDGELFYIDNPQDVNIVLLTPNLKAVTSNEQMLIEGKDYVVNDNICMLKKEFLLTQLGFLTQFEGATKLSGANCVVTFHV
jgi:AraC-like DNA-binding protein